MSNILGLTREELGFPTDCGGIQLMIKPFVIDGITRNLYEEFETESHLTILYGVTRFLSHHHDTLMSRISDLFLEIPKPDKPWNFVISHAEVFGFGEETEYVVLMIRTDALDGPGPDQLHDLFQFLPHWRDYPAYNPHVTVGKCLPGLGRFAAREINELIDGMDSQMTVQATSIDFY